MMFSPTDIMTTCDIVIIFTETEFIYDWNNPILAHVAEETVKPNYKIGYAVSVLNDLIVVFWHPSVDDRRKAAIINFCVKKLHDASNDVDLHNLN